MYKYRVVKEDILTGKQAPRSRVIERERPLAVGWLYSMICPGGIYRVLELISKD